MKYKAVLFDMDGTVLDTLEDLRSAVNRTLSEFAMPRCTLEQVRCYVGNGARRLIEQAVPEGSSEETVETALSWFKAYYEQHCLVDTAPYAGIIPLMERLKASGIKLAVVSNKPDEAVKELAERFFPGLLELAAGQKDSVPRKPAPDMVELAMKDMGVSREESVYVGDSEVDVLTAANAGLDCICVTWGFRTVAELEAAGAKTLVHTMEELENEIT